MQYYTWILAFHVMGFISWMAMLFYQPRLFVYHSENGDNKGFVKVVQRQEYILNKAIGVPAMWATILSGATMLYLNPAIFQSGGWMHAKLLFAALLVTYHFSLEQLRKKLIENAHYKSGKWFRIYNEVPTFLMVGIVIMVVIRPF
ncbi:MAG: protoporphyrinogen oxidase HemJ [Sulfurovum sp.]|nr:protoporphyrinogen oxidase HemJ [Sulfurovum sp.]MCB4759658.1 protoporphyrinogen oxidase HemJ [Sulfurovum sp.]